MADPLTSALAELFDRNPGMAARMLRVHVDDGTGHCGVCSSHNARASWPCVLAGLTARANEVGFRRPATARETWGRAAHTGPDEPGLNP